MNLPIILRFDPKNPETAQEVREIFEDDVARIIWMGFKINHIVSQHFNSAVIKLADFIRKKGKDSITVENIILYLRNYSFDPDCDFYSGSHADRRAFWGMMVPFIRGEKEMPYEIEVLDEAVQDA